MPFPARFRLTPISVLALIALGLVAFRLALSLGFDGYLGVDGGAYLLGRNAVLGDEPTGAGFPRPPFAPGWLLVPFTSAWGDDVGYKVWASVFSSVPILFGSFLLATRFLRPWIAVAMCGFLAFDLLHAEMFVTGGLPLVAFGLIAVALWAVVGLAEHGWRRREALTLAVALPSVAYVNQTSAGIAAIAIPALVLFLVLCGTPAIPLLKRLALPIGAGGLLALTALPWYLSVAPGSSILSYPGPVVYLSGWGSSVWLQFLIAVPLGIFVWMKAPRPALRAIGGLAVLHGTLLLFLSADETVINIFYRSRYFVAIPLYISAAWALSTYAPRYFSRRVTYPLGAYLLSFLIIGSIFQFYNQSRYSTFITPDMVRTIEHLEAGAPAGHVITNNFSQALWVAGLTRLPVHYTFTWEPPRAFTESDKDVRCVLGWVPECDVAGAAGRLDASYVLIDTRWPLPFGKSWTIYGAPYEEPERIWALTAAAPWLTPEYSAGSVRLWRVKL